MECVMISRFNELRRRKALEEDRDISLREVARESKLALGTIQRVASNDPELVGALRLDTINALLRYFGLNRIDELIEYRAD